MSPGPGIRSYVQPGASSGRASLVPSERWRNGVSSVAASRESAAMQLANRRRSSACDVRPSSGAGDLPGQARRLARDALAAHACRAWGERTLPASRPVERAGLVEPAVERPRPPLVGEDRVLDRLAHAALD